jgi:hypothetical protein
MPIQTSVTFEMSAAALKGQALSRAVHYVSTCYSAAETEFGVGLVYDSAVLDGDTKKVRLPTSTADSFVGVSILTGKEIKGDPDFLTTVTSTQDVKFDIGEPFPVLERGFIWVYSEQAVDVTDPVYLRCLTNATLLAGDFRKDANTATITTTALTSNVVTITTSAAHGFVVGQSVTIAGLATNTGLNGTYTIASVPTTTTFTYAKTASNISSGSEAGTIARAIQITTAKWASKTAAAGLALLQLL